jgi:DNA polymerase zeta
MKYESKDQRKPSFEAKDLETIHRDQCALTQKVIRNSLTILFRSGVNAVKNYLYRQRILILAGKLPLSDYILTGRVRSRYRGGRIGPVQAVLARRLAEADPGKNVRHNERQAYVIVATPGIAFRLRDCVLTPMELLEQWDAYTIHSAYYITKHVNAALQRCLGLAPYNVDVSSWYESCPKPRRRIHFWPATRLKAQSTMMISSFFGSDRCSLCGKKCMAQGRSRAAVCLDCRSDPVKALDSAMRRLNIAQYDASVLANKCSKCNLCFEDATTFAPVINDRSTAPLKFGSKASLTTSIVIPIANCTCIDCPATFERHRLRENELEAMAICQALDAL